MIETTDWRTARSQPRILAFRCAENCGRVATASIAQFSVCQIRDPGPDREIEVIMRLREVNPVQRAQDRTGIVPISVCEAARAQRVDDGNCQQCGLHTVTRNVEKIKGEPFRIDPMITKPISAKLRGSNHEPVC